MVVGGGMGGLNTAWRLKDSGQKIGIFERTKHLGGRVHTGRPNPTYARNPWVRAG